MPPLGDAARLPVVNLAARIRRTVAVADILEAPALEDGTLGDVRGLSEHGVRAVLATPIVAQDRLLGVLAFHRSLVGDWSPTEIALAEAVAREAAVALDTSRLLRDSDRRLAEQQALLKAGEALTSDLRFDTVIERLVEELRALVNADAADCWTLLPGGSELVCRAVLGLCRRARSAGRSRSPARSGTRSRPASRCCGASSPRPSSRRRRAATRRSRR